MIGSRTPLGLIIGLFFLIMDHIISRWNRPVEGEPDEPTSYLDYELDSDDF